MAADARGRDPAQVLRQQRDVRRYGVIAAVLGVLGVVLGGIAVALTLDGAGAIVAVLMAVALALFLAAGPAMRRAKRSREGRR